MEQVLTLLTETPPRISTLTGNLTEDQLHTAPGPGEWSANEVLAHLRACVAVWGSCIETIVNQDMPTIRAINPRSWIPKTNYLEQNFRSSLRLFSRQRNELLRTLESLPPEGWSRTATVTGAGKRLERTVLFYAQWLASHERTHVKQIERIVKAPRR